MNQRDGVPAGRSRRLSAPGVDQPLRGGRPRGTPPRRRSCPQRRVRSSPAGRCRRPAGRPRPTGSSTRVRPPSTGAAPRGWVQAANSFSRGAGNLSSIRRTASKPSISPPPRGTPRRRRACAASPRWASIPSRRAGERFGAQRDHVGAPPDDAVGDAGVLQHPQVISCGLYVHAWPDQALLLLGGARSCRCLCTAQRHSPSHCSSPGPAGRGSSPPRCAASPGCRRPAPDPPPMPTSPLFRSAISTPAERDPEPTERMGLHCRIRKEQKLFSQRLDAIGSTRSRARRGARSATAEPATTLPTEAGWRPTGPP